MAVGVLATGAITMVKKSHKKTSNKNTKNDSKKLRHGAQIGFVLDVCIFFFAVTFPHFFLCRNICFSLAVACF